MSAGDDDVPVVSEYFRKRARNIEAWKTSIKETGEAYISYHKETCSCLWMWRLQ
jgi:hypothetical protein